MFETIPMNVFTIYMSNFNLVNMGKLQMVLLLSLLRTTTVTPETDGEYQLQRIISPIALLDDST